MEVRIASQHHADDKLISRKTFNSEHFSLMETDEQMLGIDAGVLTKPDIYGNIAATQLLPFINNLSVLAGNRATGGHHSHGEQPSSKDLSLHKRLWLN